MTYTVCVTPMGGYTETYDLTAPLDNCATRVLAAGENATDVDFGYLLSQAAITIVKKTNGTDNNVAPGPTVAVGSTVTWTYLVTNTGNVTRTNVRADRRR